MKVPWKSYTFKQEDIYFQPASRAFRQPETPEFLAATANLLTGFVLG